MDSFDIARLTDVDFEAVCKDLFEEILGTRLEIFAPGADQGIDLRHLSPDGRATVIQCKHWTRAGRAALIRGLARTEVAKVRRLNPSRYVLATSVDLTPHAKTKIVDAFAPYRIDVGDIYGLKEIESEIRKRPHLVRRHLRLWLSNSAALDTLLSREIVVRSTALRAEIEDTLRTYVPNASYNRANELLERNHVCVISGIPGIGKTTLAHVIVAAHCKEGFEAVEVSEDAEEANRLWDDSVPQIFYYDDFLGQTALEDKLHKNEDGRIISLLRRTSRSPNKRFVLTTREYILAQARTRYEKLANADFDALGCVLDLADYTPLIRAEILYNHIYFSPLTAEQRVFFAAAGVHLPIIRHPNFNPRLISATVNAFVGPAQAPAEVVSALLANLSHPERLWAHIVEEQLEESDVQVLLCLLLFGSQAPLKDLEVAWKAYRRHCGLPAPSELMRRSLRILDGTVTKGAATVRGMPSVTFHNPSIRDFLQEYVQRRPDVFRALIESAVYYEQILACWRLLGRLSDTTLVPELKESLAARTVGMADAPATRARSDIEKFGTLLRLAEDFDLVALSDHVAVEANRAGLFPAADDPADVAGFLRAAVSSSNPRVRRQAGHWARLAVQDAVDNLGSWNGCVWADALLAEMGTLAPESTAKKVDDAKFALVFRAFQCWSEADGSMDQEYLEYAESFDDADRLFPHFSAVREKSRRAAARRLPPRHQESPRESAAEIDGRIETMFSSLSP